MACADNSYRGIALSGPDTAPPALFSLAALCVPVVPSENRSGPLLRCGSQGGSTVAVGYWPVLSPRGLINWQWPGLGMFHFRNTADFRPRPFGEIVYAEAGPRRSLICRSDFRIRVGPIDPRASASLRLQTGIQNRSSKPAGARDDHLCLRVAAGIQVALAQARTRARVRLCDRRRANV